jgi:hypothetical protein
VCDGEGEALDVALVEEDFDGVRARALQNGHGWKRHDHRHAEWNVCGDSWRRPTDMEFPLDIREHRIPVRVDYLDQEVVVGIRLASVIGELCYEHDS